MAATRGGYDQTALQEVLVEPAPPGDDPSTARSLLERAYVDAVEQADEADPVRARLLDAAYEQFSRTGIQRTSMEEVAKRANLSRITLYRRFATKDVLVEQVIHREFRRYFEQYIVDITSAKTVADRIVFGFVSSLRAISRNPLIGGLLESEPSLLGSIVGDDGRTFAAVREFVAGQLHREQEAGNIAADLDTDLTAELMVRISASFLMVPSQIVDLDDDEQLTAIARRYLVPMVDTVKLE